MEEKDNFEIKVDKSHLPDGEWMNEPDFEEWQEPESGYWCHVQRHSELGHLCGYVRLEEGHPCYEKHYQGIEQDIDVHGGLTFSQKTKKQQLWVLGFDMNHCWDLSPHMSSIISLGTDLRYRDFNYAKQQTNSLAKQLYEIEKNRTSGGTKGAL